MSSQPYIVSARKYRPATFNTVVGQPALTHTLKNAIESGRLAQAYLFCGPRGVGKTSSARIFAKTINCLHPTPEGEACGECESCVAIQQGNSFNLVELDAASNNSVDDIRSLCEQVNIPPSTGKYKVFIIDEVHMLTSSAFNAFLKTLEEPPRHAIFIMATTEKHKVLPTILSRCQVFDFKRITVPDMVSHLQYVAGQEGIKTEERALAVIARKADGAMRDALSIFDQVAACTEGNITYDATIENLNVLDDSYYFRLTDAFAAHDVPQALSLYAGIREKGFDSQFFINGLAAHLRNMMMMLDPRTVGLLEVGREEAALYAEKFKMFQPVWYYNAVRLLSETDLNYRQASNKQLLVEIALIRLSTPFESGAKGSTPLPALKPFATTVASRSAVPASAAAAPSPTPQAPAPASAPAQRPARRSVAPTATFRLSDAEEETAPRPEQHEPVTTARLVEALTAYTLKDSEARGLNQVMVSASYRETGEDEFTIDVPHQGALRSFEHHMIRCLPFAREFLRNDRLQLRLNVLAPDGPRRDREEVFREKMSANPVLDRFLNSGGFSIS